MTESGTSGSAERYSLPHVEEETRRWKHPEMVDWYEPGQLLRTGLSTVVSTILGEQIDRRLLGVPGKDSESVFDFSNRDTVTFDYAADTGDGWNATYALAHFLSADSINVGHRSLDRADLVVLGGDEVYPVASRDGYARRLVWPFNEAARKLNIFQVRGKERPIFMIPGNHDWYDSLAAFTRRFCNGRWIGAFATKQRRSYFVLLLPHNWQLWALDVQLGHDVDVPQFRFFRERAETLTERDRVILCSAEPEIVSGSCAANGLRFTIDRVREIVERRGAQVRLQLAGDVHNYQRYEVSRQTKDRVTYKQTQIVSGGGGAFLHPAHRFATEVPCASRYPSESVSRALTWRNLRFALSHKGFTAVVGFLYVAVFWSVETRESLLRFPIDHPGSAATALGLLSVLVAFAAGSMRLKCVLGVVHWIAQLLAAYVTWRAAFWLVSGGGDVGPLATLSPLTIYLQKVLHFLLGGLLGATVFGVYLIAALELAGVHHNETFSGLAIEDYKHFLRCTVEKDSLTIRVVAIPHVGTLTAALVEEVSLPG